MFFLSPLKNISFINHNISDYCMNIFSTALQYEILNKTSDLEPFYKLKKDDEIYGYDKLRKYNIKNNDWFITIHA